MSGSEPDRFRNAARAWAVVVALAVVALGVWWIGRPFANSRVAGDGSDAATNAGRPPRELAPAPSKSPREPRAIVESDRLARIELRGAVIDAETRRPVPGATVWTIERSADTASAAGTSVRTDGEGRFTLGASGAGADDAKPPRVAVAALARGYRPHVREEPIASSGTEIAIELVRGAAIEGSVVDENGTPIPDATVRAMGVLGEEVRSLDADGTAPFVVTRPPDFGLAVTDAAGRFVIAGLVEGHDYRLAARHPAHAEPFLAAPPPSVGALPGQLVQIRMKRLFGLRVLAVDADTGAPVRGSSIGFTLPAGRQLDPNTDATAWNYAAANLSAGGIASDGERSFRSAINGTDVPTMGVRASAPGYESVRAEFALERWPAAPRSIRLPKVRDARVVEVPVSATFPDGHGFDGLLYVTYERPGSSQWLGSLLRFRGGRSLDTLPFDASLRGVEFRLGGYGEATGNWERPASPVRFDPEAGGEVRFALQGACVRLRVRDASGDTLRGCQLSITGGSTISVPQTWISDQHEPGLIEPDGSLRLWFDEMTVHLGVRKVGYRAVTRDVVVPGDGSTLDVNVVLEAEGG